MTIEPMTSQILLGCSNYHRVMGPSHGEQVTGFGVATQEFALSNTLTNLHHASTLRKCSLCSWRYCVVVELDLAVEPL